MNEGNKNSVKAVIIAGGSGTRLWPMSRKSRPKQFQAMTSDQTMLQETYNRLLERFDAHDIYIATNDDYVSLVKEQIVGIADENVIAETAQRDTASAIALVCAVVGVHDPEALVAVFPADHVIHNADVLIGGVDTALSFLLQEPSYILTFGITQTRPDTGYGYIKKGDVLMGEGAQSVFRAQKFVEKPDHETAQKYLDEGGYYWNAGMFMFHVGEMIKKYAQYVPDTHKRLLMIREAVGTPAYDQVMRAEFAQMDKISVDYAIMENAEDVALIPLALDWSDVGNWAALKDALIEDSHEHLSRGEHIDFGSKNVVAIADQKPIITVGLEDMVVIDTEDALLVCTQAEAANLSRYVKEMGKDRESLL